MLKPLDDFNQWTDCWNYDWCEIHTWAAVLSSTFNSVSDVLNWASGGFSTHSIWGNVLKRHFSSQKKGKTTFFIQVRHTLEISLCSNQDNELRKGTSKYFCQENNLVFHKYQRQLPASFVMLQDHLCIELWDCRVLLFSLRSWEGTFYLQRV